MPLKVVRPKDVTLPDLTRTVLTASADMAEALAAGGGSIPNLQRMAACRRVLEDAKRALIEAGGVVPDGVL